jgi:hypothetical protein
MIKFVLYSSNNFLIIFTPYIDERRKRIVIIAIVYAGKQPTDYTKR